MISENIKRLRKENGYTQQGLAKVSGLSVATIQGYEQGKYKPKIDSLKKLSKTLHCDISDILGEDYSMFSEEEKNLIEKIDLESFEKAVEIDQVLAYYLPLTDENKDKALDYMDLLKLRQDQDKK